jgi:hypothetical protein
MRLTEYMGEGRVGVQPGGVYLYRDLTALMPGEGTTTSTTGGVVMAPSSAPPVPIRAAAIQPAVAR